MAPRPLKPVDRSGPAQGLHQPPGPGAAPPLGLCFPGTLDGPHSSPSAPHPGLTGGHVRLQANRRALGSLAPRAGVGLLGVNAGRGPGCQRPAEAGRPGWPGGGEAGPQREVASRRHCVCSYLCVPLGSEEPGASGQLLRAALSGRGSHAHARAHTRPPLHKRRLPT